MRKKTANKIIEPIGKLNRVEDFLPPPNKLFPEGDDKIKVTLALDESTLKFFKSQSKELGSKYQKIIREVLRLYVAHYSTK